MNPETIRFKYNEEAENGWSMEVGPAGCTFCDNKNTEVKEGTDESEGLYWVACGECGATGPTAGYVGAAMVAWALGGEMTTGPTPEPERLTEWQDSALADILWFIHGAQSVDGDHPLDDRHLSAIRSIRKAFGGNND